MGKKFIYYNSVNPPYLVAANKFIDAAVYTNAGVKTAIRDHFKRLYDNALETKISFMYMDTIDISDGSSFADKWAQMKWNAIDPRNLDAAYRQTVINTPVLSKYGIKCNGGTNYIFTHCNPSTDPILRLNGSTFGIYCNEAGSPDEFKVDMGISNQVSGVTSSVYVGGRYYTTLAGSGVYTDVVSLNGVSQQFITPVGGTDVLTTINRTDATNVRIRRNGVQQFDRSIASVTEINGNISRFGAALYIEGVYVDTGGIPTRRQCHAFAARFTDVELAIYEDSINIYQGDIETALGLTSGSRKIY